MLLTQGLPSEARKRVFGAETGRFKSRESSTAQISPSPRSIHSWLKTM